MVTRAGPCRTAGLELARNCVGTPEVTAVTRARAGQLDWKWLGIV